MSSFHPFQTLLEAPRGASAAYTLFLQEPHDAYVLARYLQALTKRWKYGPHKTGNVLLFPHEKAVKTFLSRRHKLYKHKQSSSILQWPQIDYWNTYRTSYPQHLATKKMQTLWHLHHSQDVLLITSLPALMERTMGPFQFQEQTLVLKQGQNISCTDICQHLQELGYTQRSHDIDGYGEYFCMGPRIEVRTCVQDHPVRIEVQQDRITAITCTAHTEHTLPLLLVPPCTEWYLPQHQRHRCAQHLHELLLAQETQTAMRLMTLEQFQRHDFLLSHGRYGGFLRAALDLPASTLVDHLTAHDRQVVVWDLSDPEQGELACSQIIESATNTYEWERQESLATVSPQYYYADISQVRKQLQQTSKTLHGHAQDLPILAHTHDLLSSPLKRLKAQTPEDTSRVWETLLRGLQAACEGNHKPSPAVKPAFSLHKVVIAYQDSFAKQAVETRWQEHRYAVGEISSFWDLETVLQHQHSILLVHGTLPCDYYLPQEGILYVDSSFLLQGHPQRAVRTKSQRASDHKPWQNYLRSLSHIQRGDLVVHRDHGIGRYLGLTVLEVGDHRTECLKIGYAGSDKIYLPVDHISRLQKYDSSAAASSASSPSSAHTNEDFSQFSAMGSDRLLDHLSKPQSWQKNKARVKRAVKDLAADILKVHSKRELQTLKPYPPPGPNYHQFVEAFAHVETEDQERFEADLEEDFGSAKPLDRLLIGDVGFGKTEMAMRACMRTVLEGYQVMVLCPTTVLCYQHHQTFRNRMAPWKIAIASVSRFITPAQSQKIAQQFSHGALQVLIGTHKLLSSEFQPQNLGLVIVDEEQRFGVTHKEKIKALRANSGVLSLSATPIPRTLHMSMLGLRDISLLTTPPEGRLPIKNTISAWDDDLIRRALAREHRRGGQIFFVHNRVQDLEAYAQMLHQLAPHMEVRMAHGQMAQKDLEQVMLDFIQGLFPILLSTTIVESGIDMPHVNTIFIHRAERYGLAQLYQLRGRVGRAGVQAYAYLITSSPLRQLPDDARKRMEVMMNYQELGAGFSIASYDMDFRGVGDLLGQEQSGHLATVGLEMYTQMLSEAIKQARGESLNTEQGCDVKISIAFGLDESYIHRESLRLQLYRRLFLCPTEDAIAHFMRDLEERYGPIPDMVLRLCEVARLKLSLKALAVRCLKEKNNRAFELYIPKLPNDRIDGILKILSDKPRIFQLQDAQHIVIRPPPSHASSSKPQQRLQQLYKHVQMLVAASKPS